MESAEIKFIFFQLLTALSAKAGFAPQGNAKRNAKDNEDAERNAYEKGQW